MDVYELGDGQVASLTEILEDKKLREVFRYHLARHWMDEPLDVWGKLEEIDKAPDDETKGKAFAAMCERHFLSGCVSPVNVESFVTEVVLEEYQAVTNSSSLSSSSSSSLSSSPFTFCAAGGSPSLGARGSLPSDRRALSKQVFQMLQSEVWLLLSGSCLPSFAMSETYQEFLEGKVDSSAIAFSREKAEQFFGCKLTGPLQRNELLTAIPDAKYVSVLRFRSMSPMNIFRSNR